MLLSKRGFGASGNRYVSEAKALSPCTWEDAEGFAADADADDTDAWGRDFPFSFCFTRFCRGPGRRLLKPFLNDFFLG